VNVSKLSGATLDYWVARALGHQPDINKIKPGGDWCAIEMRSANVATPDFDADPSERACGIAMVPNAIREFPACVLGQKIGRGKRPYRASWFYPSTLWDHGGPIIEREQELIDKGGAEGIWKAQGVWKAQLKRGGYVGEGETLLIAAMRAFVASKCGEAVPDEVK
jgi:hypothetical protein